MKRSILYVGILILVLAYPLHADNVPSPAQPTNNGSVTNNSDIPINLKVTKSDGSTWVSHKLIQKIKKIKSDQYLGTRCCRLKKRKNKTGVVSERKANDDFDHLLGHKIFGMGGDCF